MQLILNNKIKGKIHLLLSKNILIKKKKIDKITKKQLNKMIILQIKVNHQIDQYSMTQC